MKRFALFVIVSEGGRRLSKGMGLSDAIEAATLLNRLGSNLNAKIKLRCPQSKVRVLTQDKARDLPVKLHGATAEWTFEEASELVAMCL